MSGSKNLKSKTVFDLIEEEEGRVSINLVTPKGSPEPVPIKKEPTPPPPKPKVVTSGPATLKSATTLDGVKVVQSASAGAAGGSAKISKAGAAAEARAQIRNDAKEGWNAANARGPATTVVKSEPGAGGSANTVVNPEPGAGGSAVDPGETTDEWSGEEEERPPKRARVVRKSHRTDNPL